MTKGSKSSTNSAPTEHFAVSAFSTPPTTKTTVSYNKASGGAGGSYQNKSQVSYSDKQTGCYQRSTTTEKASAGEFQWKNGTTGTRSEYQQSSTVRVGDKSGYTEVYSEQRVRNVTYDRSNVSSSGSGGDYIANDNGHGGRGYITYDNGRGGRGYGGYY